MIIHIWIPLLVFRTYSFHPPQSRETRMSEEAWNAAGRGVVWMRYPWGGSFALRPAHSDNNLSHSGPGHRPRDGAVGDRRTTPSSSASPVETGSQGYRTSRRARGLVELASSPATSDGDRDSLGFRIFESSPVTGDEDRDSLGYPKTESPPVTGDEDRHPRPAKAQQTEPCPEDQVYEAANPLRQQAKWCIEICGTVLAEFETEMAGLKKYVDQGLAACLWKMKLERLGAKSQDKDKNVELQLMCLDGCIHRMEVAAYLLQRQLAAEDGDGNDSRLAILKQIMEHTKVIRTLSIEAGSSNTQCKHLVEKLLGLVRLLETKEGAKPFAIFRFGQTELQAHDNRAERHDQQQQTDQQHKDGQQDKNKKSIKKNQHGENGGWKKTEKPSENDERPDNGPAVENKEDAENGYPQSNEQTEEEALAGIT